MMHGILAKACALLLIIFSPQVLWGQTGISFPDQMVLKNGEVRNGKWQEGMTNGDILFLLSNGNQLVFNAEEVKTVYLGPTDWTTQLFDRVVLKNGTELLGVITERRRDNGRIYLLVENGNILPVRVNEIRLVERGVEPMPDNFQKKPSPEISGEAEDALPDPTEPVSVAKVFEYAFREEGWYVSAQFVAMNGRNSGSYQLGIGLHTSVGYQWNRWLGAGVGTGFDAYGFEFGEYVIPVFAEVRGYLLKKQLSPYYNVIAGYGFPLATEANDVVRADGSLLFHPAIGLRFGADPDVNILLDVGYRFQSAVYFREFGDSGIREREEIDYRRLTLRFGLLF